MKAQTAIALAAAALLSGVTAASAADIPSSHSGMAVKASDTLSLNATQQKTAWNDINKQASNQNAAGGFHCDARRGGPDHAENQRGAEQSGARRAVAAAV